MVQEGNPTEFSMHLIFVYVSTFISRVLDGILEPGMKTVYEQGIVIFLAHGEPDRKIMGHFRITFKPYKILK